MDHIQLSGYEHVKQVFAQKKKRAQFMPYWMVGYPDLPASIDMLEGLAKAGADMIEVGVPFSDPIADGITIQEAGQVALSHKTSLPDAIQAVRELRERGVTIPLLLMSYANPLIAYGQEAVVRDANAAGVSGFIVPDLPPDEADEFQCFVEKEEMALAHFVAPTSNEKRISLAGAKARGFIYLVSVMGVTGAREDKSLDLGTFIKRVRQLTQQPLVVGFGIASPEKAAEIGKQADGVIMASKLINIYKEKGQAATLEFAGQVRAALE